MRPKALLPAVLVALTAARVSAQTIDDSVMMRKNSLCTGLVYSHDRWESYWEGPLKRVNGNIGKITTQSVAGMLNYGVTDRLNVIATLPYVWTEASQGVLHGVSGWQDLTVAAKFNILETEFTRSGSLRTIIAVAAGTPIGDYTPDFQPLSLGNAAKTVSGRFTLNFQSNPGYFLNGSTGYTWRSDVTLDRPYYYTDGQLFLTNEVEMPEVFDYVVSAGYLKHGLNTEFSFRQQRMQAGGDIRRQDMPFVSNRMNLSQVGAMVLYPVPKLRRMEAKFAFAYTVDGRNVGQGTTLMTALQYRFSLFKGSK